MKRRSFLQAILGAAGLASAPKVTPVPEPSTERVLVGIDLAVGPDQIVETLLSYRIKTKPDGELDVTSFVHPRLRRGGPDE